MVVAHAVPASASAAMAAISFFMVCISFIEKFIHGVCVTPRQESYACRWGGGKGVFALVTGVAF